MMFLALPDSHVLIYLSILVPISFEIALDPFEIVLISNEQFEFKLIRTNFIGRQYLLFNKTNIYHL